MKKRHKIKANKKKLIAELRELLRERERRMEASQPKAVVATLPKVLAPVESNPNSKPKSLEGMSYGEIRLLQCDGMLTPEEERWLQNKFIPYYY